MSRPPAVGGPFRGVFVLYVFENHPSKRRLNTSNPLKITPLQRGDPDVTCGIELEGGVSLRGFCPFFRSYRGVVGTIRPAQMVAHTPQC